MDLAELEGKLTGAKRLGADRLTFQCPLCNRPSDGKHPSVWMVAGTARFFCPNGCLKSDFEKITANGHLQAQAKEPSPIVQPKPKSQPVGAPVSRASVPARVERSVDIVRRVPPQDLQAEESVLGAIFLEPSSIEEALAVLTTEDFYREAHRTLFRVLLRLWRQQVGIDVVTVMAELRTDRKVEEVGGTEYIARLAADVPTAANIKHYAQIVHNMAVKRQIASAATELATLAYDGVSSDALVGEAHRRLMPFLSDVPAPIEESSLHPVGLGDLYGMVDEWDRQPWVWDGILPRSSLSLIVGKAETGKSTLIYGLIYAIVKGLTFFGRQCEQGRVLYLAGDPISEIVAGKTFRGLGLESGDGVQVVAGALVGHSDGMKKLRRWVEEFRPTLVVGDTLAETVGIDTDKYGQSYQVQQPLTQIAREFGPNFLMAHHSQKSAIDTYSVIDAALGSVGVAAVASSRMATRMYRRQGKRFYTFEMSNLRLGQPIEGEHIVEKLENGMLELGQPWGKQTVAMDRDVILEALRQQTDPIAERTLWNDVTPKPKWQAFKQALRALLDDRLIQVQSRRKSGGGKLYSLAQPEARPLPWNGGDN